MEPDQGLPSATSNQFDSNNNMFLDKILFMWDSSKGRQGLVTRSTRATVAISRACDRKAA